MARNAIRHEGRWGIWPKCLMMLALLAILFSPASRPQSVAHGAGLLNLPPGFADETVVSGLLAPRAFVFTPDGRILFAERGSDTSVDINYASIRVFKNGALLPQRAITLNVCGDGERGFLGIALDPNFSTNGYLYVYYTAQNPSPTSQYPTCSEGAGHMSYTDGYPGPRNRISRLTMVGDTIDPATETVLVDNLPTDTGLHNAGDLHFGQDGYLYASVGNSNLDSPILPGEQPMSQELTRLGGKLLRIKPDPAASDGSGYDTTGNPFDNQLGAWKCGPRANVPPPQGPVRSGPCKEIFAYGFRNPFRFAMQPGAGLTTSVPFVGDVGGGAWEEVDRVIPGGNYGWPVREGPCDAGVITASLCSPDPLYLDPAYAYSHITLGGGAAIIVGDFYTGTVTSYPSQYWNNFFFADLVNGWIRRLVYDGNSDTWNAQTPDFATGGNSIIGLKMGPDGNLYYLFYPDDNPDSELHRLCYGSMCGPVAQISADPISGPQGQLFTFSAAGSYDANNLPLTYHWDLGDGTVISSTSAITVTHSYTDNVPTAVTVSLSVENSQLISSQPVSLTVYADDPPPTGTIVLTNTTNLSRTVYYGNDTWAFGASNAVDGSGQPLPASALSWEVRLQHQQHWHPFQALASVPQGQFTLPTVGETDPVQWYRVMLRLTDALGQTTTVYRDILPATATVTLDTSVPNGQVTVVGWGTNPAPWSVTRVINMKVDIGVPSPQWINGLPYTFSAWSNGGSQNQSVTVPPGGATYTAILLPSFQLWLPLISR